MGDSDDAFEVFMEQLDLRVGGLDAGSLVGLINLLQQRNLKMGDIPPYRAARPAPLLAVPFNHQQNSKSQ